MKKILSILLIGVLVFGMTACGGGAGSSGSTDSGDKPKETIVIKAAHVEVEDRAIHQALVKFGEYIAEQSDGVLKLEIYPNGDNTAQAYRYIIELRDKLAYKGFLNARLYYNLGTYMGNNYQSAVIEAENTLKDYPETKYRDDLVFLILQSKAKEASLSVHEKRAERYSEVIDEYYRYANEFTDGKNIREANRILKEAKQFVK